MRYKASTLRIIDTLKELYPEGLCSLQYEKDYELLFAVRLSAQCTDARVNMVTPALFARFPTLEAFAEADPKEVGEYIHSCGFYNGKSRDLVACAQQLLERFGGRVDAGAVAAAALYHDASEILTGDMPTPIKSDNPAIRKAYKDVEAVAEEKLLHMLPQEFRSVYAPVLRPDAETEQLVKAADKLSAYIKCVEELKAGNNEFREAAAQTRTALEDYGLPEVAYFLETFLPSFSLTLDELK